MRPACPLLGLLLAAAGSAQAQHRHAHPPPLPASTAPAAASAESDPPAAHHPAAPPSSPQHPTGHAATAGSPSPAAQAHGAHHPGHTLPAAPAVDPHAVHRAAPAISGQQAAPAQHAGLPAPTEAELAAAFPVLQAHTMPHASAFNHLLRVDQLEAWDATAGQGQGQAWEITGWAGGDTDRLWLRSAGEREHGRLQHWSAEVLYGHALSPWWEVLAGLRHDAGRHGQRNRAGIGVQGMAPYKFELAATLWLGGPRRAELEVQAGYTLLLSNRLILQPSIQARVVADDDLPAGIGRGLGEVETGLRLRYEVTRRFAPYIGYAGYQRLGRSARLSQAAGLPTREQRWLAGVRFWF